MKKIQKIFRKCFELNSPWKIIAAVFLICIGIAASQRNVDTDTFKKAADLSKSNLTLYSGRIGSSADFQYTKYKLLDINQPKPKKSDKRSCSKSKTDCLDVNPVEVYGPVNNSNNEKCAGFSREVDAVIAAMNEYNPLSVMEDREYMGVIMKSCGRFYYTVTPGKPGSSKASIKIQRWMLEKATALWHTHGAYSLEHKYFSDVDTSLANSLNRSFYLGDAEGNLRIYKPGGNLFSPIQRRQLGLPCNRGSAPGKTVTDENAQVITIDNDISIRPSGLKNGDNGFTITCINKST